jgi:aryl-alcohol dehydrogenase-like predicted oxidoreductase
MQYRNFGNTGLVVSEIGFGAWAIGGGAMVGDTAIGWGDVNDAHSAQAVEAAIEAGITFFDTADIYGLGHSESILGMALEHHPDVAIATKVGNVARNGQFTTDYTKEHILSACEESLKRLKRDTIDYYQLHTVKRAQLEEGSCIEAMQLLQEQGKIRYWGVSLNTFDPMPEAAYCMEKGIGSGFQLVLNLVNQQSLELITAAAEQGYGMIARMPLQFGLLTGKFSASTQFDKNDHRHKRLTPQLITQAETALQPVWDLCTKYGCTKTAMALSYILSYDEVSTVIPGIRTASQVHSNTTGLVKLEAGDKAMIEALGTGPFVHLLQAIKAQG